MARRKALLRADGNIHIGLGHIYRCIALAEMLKEDLNCEFLLADNTKDINIIPPQFTVNYIPSNISLSSEALWIKENYDEDSLIFILDGYQFDAAYQKKIKEQNIKLVYIDDLAKEHMFADIVINHAPSANTAIYAKEDYTQLFLGPQYVLLRNEFLQKAKEEKQKFKKINTVLITLGGSDENNITLKILESIIDLPQIESINIVTGAAYPYKELLLEKTKAISKKINLFSNLSENQMINLMNLCDAAFAPCSTTCFELFAVNMPVFAGFSATNQFDFYNYLKSKNFIFDLGNLQQTTVKEIKDTVAANLNNITAINKMLTLQKQLIDGNSGQRIKKSIENLG